MTDRDDVVAHLRRAADALEQAGKHCRIAADHLEKGQVPRMGAHAFAARGDLSAASDELDSAAQLHARHSSTQPAITAPPIDPEATDAEQE